jgi:hypothetical protein
LEDIKTRREKGRISVKGEGCQGRKEGRRKGRKKGHQGRREGRGGEGIAPPIPRPPHFPEDLASAHDDEKSSRSSNSDMPLL